jgi:hypothetical protein
VEFINVEHDHKIDLPGEVESAAISGARFGRRISTQAVQRVSIDRITGVADSTAVDASIYAAMYALLIAVNHDFSNREPEKSNWSLKYARKI